MDRQIILDTETTGLSPEQGHRVIEIGCLEMVNRRITGDTFHRYINPERDIERGAEEVHGITGAFLQDKPRFAEVVEEFLEYVRGAELIIHNAPFDVGFLDHELRLCGKRDVIISDICAITDSLLMARTKHPGQKNNLDALCRRYSVDNSNRDLHGALLDAELLAQVYLLMTGGQSQLFSDEDTEVSVGPRNQRKRRISKNRDPLRVVRANAAELAAHEAMMEALSNS